MLITIKHYTRSLLILISILSVNVNATEVSLFGDASYSDSNDDASNSAFAIGGLDLFINQRISSNTTAFAEVVFENDGGGFVLDVERLWISRSINENLDIGLGRFHTPLGHWNRAYHHGALLFDTVSRPSFLDFEDGNSAVLPVHVVGLQAEGKISMSSGDLNYVFNISNGPSYDTSGGFGSGEIEINNVSDANDDKSIALQLAFALSDSNLVFGFSMMSNVIAESATTGSVSGVALGDDLIDQLIIGVHTTYITDTMDVFFEYYNLKNDDKFGTTGSQTGSVAYAQFGYQATDSIKTVYRYETIDFDANDVYATLLGAASGDRHVVALRKDLDETNALKIEVANNKPDGAASVTEYSVQWTFLIP